MDFSIKTNLLVLTTYYVLATYHVLTQVGFSIKTNLLVLKAQLCALRHFSIDPRSTPVYHKYFMFRRLTGLAAGCVLAAITSSLSLSGISTLCS